jgi:hypothetical protein
MGWLRTALFGTAGSPAADRRLCAYGKLPFYRDFLSLRGDSPAAKRFRAWLDAGFAGVTEMGGRAAGPMIGRPTRMFLAPGDGVREGVAAILWDSRDQTGTREFPIVLFSVIDGSEISPGTPGLLGRLQPVWDSLAAHQPAIAGCETAPEFYERFAETAVTPPADARACRERFEDVLRTVHPTDWLRSMGRGGGQVLPDDYVDGLAILMRGLQILRDDPFSSALRFPIGAVPDPLTQMDLWASLAAARSDPNLETPIPSVWLPLEEDGGADAGADGVATRADDGGPPPRIGCLALRKLRINDARLFGGRPPAPDDAYWVDLATHTLPEGIEAFAARFDGHVTESSDLSSLLSFHWPD